MGNLSSVCTDKGGSPDLETLFEVRHDKNFDCSIHPSFRSCLHLWRIYSDKDDDTRIRDAPLRVTSLQKFDSKSCYIVLRVENIQTNENKTANPTTTSTVNNNVLSALISSSKEVLTPKGLSLPFGFASFEPLASSSAKQKGVLRHVLYLWNGKDSTDLTRAVALGKSLAIDRLLGTEEKALRLLFSDSQKVAFTEIFSSSDLAKAALDWNHLLFHLETMALPTFDAPQTEKIILPAVNKISPIPSPHSCNGELVKPRSEEIVRSVPKIPPLTVPQKAPTVAAMAIPLLKVPERNDPDQPTRPPSHTFNSFGKGPAIPKLAVPGLPSLPSKDQPAPAPEVKAPIIHPSGYKEDMGVSEKQRKEAKLAFFDKICSKITSDIFLGSQTIAMDKNILKENGVTHILNCAGAVCSNYHPEDFTYKTLYLGDGNQEDIGCMFYDVIDFIENAHQNQGKVFIHCQQGVSRSSAMTICYLMWKNGTIYNDTHKMVKELRGVSNPNTGFMWQLTAWEKRLKGLEGTNPRLYRILPHCKQAPDFIVMKQFPEAKASVLDPRNCFLLHARDRLIIWVGSECPAVLIEAAKKWATRLQKYEKAPETIEQVNQGSEPPTFWQYLGGAPTSEITYTKHGNIEYAISLFT
eukprot:TRINITY_DN13931_c0_g1_i1.p1 TRINITY_DN13931_c0_g1~~TRINITY_DN13931_c0_g1_i1.p1  ORF type:complete len:636 (+),score=100.00 TRINITY_DN13931_c0_g1_i1:162-2069(+)